MANFTPRTTAPATTNSYYYDNNVFYQSGYGLPNCTCYAWGRFYELSGERPNLSTADAESWYGTDDGYSRGQTPKLGAVICWRRGVVGDDSDGAGHVAIVEKINADGSIETSNSAYGGSLFYMQTLTKESNYELDSRYTFQGFIYNPVNFDSVVDPDYNPTTTEEIQQYVYDFLYEKGLPHISTCALMGNITGESSWDPDAIEYGSGIGFGLCQWSFGRRTQLEAYGTTLYHQCEFLWSELTGENTSVTGADFQWISDPADSVDNGEGFVFSITDFLNGNGSLEVLTKAFCYCWERPAYATNHLDTTRIPSARDFYNTMSYSGGGVIPTPGKKERKKFNFILFKKRRLMQ